MLSEVMWIQKDNSHMSLSYVDQNVECLQKPGNQEGATWKRGKKDANDGQIIEHRRYIVKGEIMRREVQVVKRIGRQVRKEEGKPTLRMLEKAIQNTIL